jgi:D-alanyl-D-alanine carboxypeptidase
MRTIDWNLLMTGIIDNSDSVERPSPPGRFVIGLIVLTAVAVTTAHPALAQTTRDSTNAPRAKSEQKTAKAEKPVPPPEVVNAEETSKEPPDPPDGPPYSTAKAWAIADGRSRQVLWGHRETERLKPASTTNTNHLLEIAGYDGVKTGTTNAAGTCLVASGRRGQDHLIVVILGGSNSPDSRYADARNLFRWAWQMRGQRGQTTEVSSGSPIR